MPKRIDSALRNDPETGVRQRPRKLQTKQPEHDLGGRIDRNLRRRRQRLDARNGSREALSHGLRIHGVGQASDDVAGIGDVEGRAHLRALVEFVELPLGGFGMKMRRALAHDFRSARRQKQLQSFHVGPSGKLLALVVHPENAEGQQRIHARLRLLGIDAEHGKRRLPSPQHGAGVHRAERMFKIGAAAQMLELEAGILAQQDPLAAAADTGCGPQAWPRPCAGRHRRKSPGSRAATAQSATR